MRLLLQSDSHTRPRKSYARGCISNFRSTWKTQVGHRAAKVLTCYRVLTAALGEAEILAEERHHMILKSIGDGAGVRAGVDLKAVRDSVVVENIVQLSASKRSPS